MADNVTLNAMSGGEVVASDQIGADHYQLIKLADGTADSATVVAVDLGVKANALRVAPVSDLTDATYIGDIKFGESLPAGTNGIGKLTANTGVDIGDVDVLSVAGNVTVVQGTSTNLKADITIAAAQTLATVTTVGTVTTITNDVNIADGGNAITIDWAGTAPPIGAGVEATALRVTVATDSTGVLSIDDNGGSLTVDNAGLTELAAAINASSQMDINIAASNATVTVDNGGTFAVQSTLQTGSNAIGKLAANSGVDIGDVDVTSIVLPRSVIGPGEPGTAVDSLTHVAINLTTGADQVLVASAPSKQVWVYGYALTCGDANGQTVSLQDEDNVAITGIMEFAQYGGISAAPSGNFSMPLFKLGTDKDLEIDITGGDVDGFLVYSIMSV